jgi:hypothetical protein
MVVPRYVLRRISLPGLSQSHNPIHLLPGNALRHHGTQYPPKLTEVLSLEVATCENPNSTWCLKDEGGKAVVSPKSRCVTCQITCQSRKWREASYLAGFLGVSSTEFGPASGNDNYPPQGIYFTSTTPSVSQTILPPPIPPPPRPPPIPYFQSRPPVIRTEGPALHPPTCASMQRGCHASRGSHHQQQQGAPPAPPCARRPFGAPAACRPAVSYSPVPPPPSSHRTRGTAGRTPEAQRHGREDHQVAGSKTEPHQATRRR